MRQPRKILENQLILKFNTFCYVRNKVQEKCKFLEEKYNIPSAVSSDYITEKRLVSQANMFLLYAFADSVGLEKEKFFSDEEIKTFSTMMYEKPKVDFPLVIKPVIQISDDQWITSMTVKQIVNLGNNGLINYNENAQRVMKHIIKDGYESFQISVNKKSVDEIKRCFSNGTYIPDTITLNIPVDSDYVLGSDYITINDMKAFDIIDGYHRYVAMNSLCSSDENFDYKMEVRITLFEESKAQQFIYQQDQKNKMKKIDSDSFNQNSVANIIISRLKFTNAFMLKDMLGKNDSVILESELSFFIDKLMLKGLSTKEMNAQSNTIKNTLVYGFNELYENHQDVFEKGTLSHTDMFIIVYAIYMNSKLPFTTVSEWYNKIKTYATANNFKLPSGKIPSKPVLERIKDEA